MRVDKKHDSFDPSKVAARNGFHYRVSIPWDGQPNVWWNESCADVLEVFGLPGNRFTTHPSIDNMDFFFKSEKDAELCKILLSEKV